MTTIDTTAVVTADHKLVVEVSLPAHIPPGQHRVLVVLEEVPTADQPQRPLQLPLLDVKTWPENLSLRREDMYDDWGR
jgi:hypothetical protein